MIRVDGRRPDELRAIRILPGAQVHAEGSVTIEMGQTRVLCAVSVEDGVPSFLRGSGKGWVTAEYGMLPRSTVTRTPRESTTGRPRGRSAEIQRLIGRSLRTAVDLDLLGERTLTVDCDVLQADGGTRTAAITGGYVALHQAFHTLIKRGVLPSMPVKCAVAAVSAGVVDGRVLLDLCYEEDYRAEADFNIVMTDQGDFVEVQGTAEGEPFSKDVMDRVLSLCEAGMQELLRIQADVIEDL